MANLDVLQGLNDRIDLLRQRLDTADASRRQLEDANKALTEHIRARWTPLQAAMTLATMVLTLTAAVGIWKGISVTNELNDVKESLETLRREHVLHERTSQAFTGLVATLSSSSGLIQQAYREYARNRWAAAADFADQAVDTLKQTLVTVRADSSMRSMEGAVAEFLYSAYIAEAGARFYNKEFQKTERLGEALERLMPGRSAGSHYVAVARHEQGLINEETIALFERSVQARRTANLDLLNLAEQYFFQGKYKGCRDLITAYFSYDNDPSGSVKVVTTFYWSYSLFLERGGKPGIANRFIQTASGYNKNFRGQYTTRALKRYYMEVLDGRAPKMSKVQRAEVVMAISNILDIKPWARVDPEAEPQQWRPPSL